MGLQIDIWNTKLEYEKIYTNNKKNLNVSCFWKLQINDLAFIKSRSRFVGMKTERLEYIATIIKIIFMLSGK